MRSPRPIPSPASPVMADSVSGNKIRMCGACCFRLEPPRNSVGNREMKLRALSNSDLGEPILSTYSSLREPNPANRPRLNWLSEEAIPTVSHDIPISRVFSVMPGSALRQRSTNHSIHSSCFGNKRNGIRAGNPRSTLRGSTVMPQSIMNCAGLSL